MADSDTIFALATPPGRSALAVFRISGARAGLVLEKLCRKRCPAHRSAVVRDLYDPATGEAIDQVVATYFKSPASYTGEDVVELSVHGGRGVISSLSSVLSRFDQVRAAEPGEFTRRAYAAGKIDLTQAEAIADLIDSETNFQRRQAIRLLEGGLGRLAEGWRKTLLAISADVESALDFSDEADVTELEMRSVSDRSELLAQAMEAELAVGRRSMALRNGFTVVIAGAPNVGKSTLFNLLAGSDIAIVTEHAGTTRDLVKVDLDLSGVPVTLVDSAGIRESDDPVERIGVERARMAAASADLVLFLETGAVTEGPVLDSGPVLKVWSKADIHAGPDGVLAISSNEPGSISHVISSIRSRAVSLVGDGSEGVLIRERHRQALSGAIGALRRVQEFCSSNRPELAAEELRLANHALGSISGSFGAEDVLGEIFGRFCIGK